MNWFGKSWDAPVCEPSTHIDIPVGESCVHCAEPIGADDAGVTTAALIAVNRVDAVHYHKNCWLSEVVGSLAHQLRTCKCHGGDGHVPAGLTVREQADMAVDIFYRQQEYL